MAKVYNKFDIIIAFNKIRIRKGHKEKTAFLTRYKLYKYIIILFRLYNTLVTFQAFINKTLREYLDNFCTAYLNNILIYSNTIREYIGYIQKVLDKLLGAGLFLDINKYNFYIKKIKYLGLIIAINRLKINLKKVKTIKNQKLLQYIKDVQAFLGFTNFYRRFIKDYLKITAPLINLIKTNSSKLKNPSINILFLLVLNSIEKKAFKALKEVFIKAPILTHFNPDREIQIEIDASDYITARVLSQKDNKDILRPVTFISYKITLQKYNYEIYNKELLTIIRTFKEQYLELVETPIGNPIKILTNYKNLEYFITTK